MRPRVKEMLQGFERTYGSMESRDLVPYGFSSPDRYEAFRKSGVKQQNRYRYVKYAVPGVGRWNDERRLVPKRTGPNHVATQERVS